MARTSVRGVKIPVLLPLSVAILVLLVVSVVSIHLLQRNNIESQVRSNLSAVNHLLKTELDEDAKLMSGLMDFLMTDEELHRAWVSRDRKALLHHATPIFENIRSKYRVTHFYFHNPERICFLRVHNPPRHGDFIGRFTMDGAAKKSLPAHGIELGPFGTFTLRVVHPWRIDGELVGYIELGEEIEHLTPRLKEVSGAELFFTINKSYLDRAKWEEGMQMIGHEGDWDAFANFVIINQTMSELPAGLYDHLATLASCGGEEHLDSIIKMSSDDRHYEAGFVALVDAGGQDVGDIIVLAETTRQEAELRGFSALVILIGGVIGLGLVGLFYVYVQRIEQRIGKAYEEIAREVKVRQRAEEQAQRQNEYLNGLLECLPYPFHVIDANDYTIKIANSATNAGDLSEKPKCHMVSHHLAEPCAGDDDPCPLEKAKKTREAVVMEHVHYGKDGKRQNVDVHCYPIIDKDGNVTEVIEQCLDITKRREAEEKLRKNMQEMERFNRLAVGREMQMIELKREINALLAELGKEEKYRTDRRCAEVSSSSAGTEDAGGGAEVNDGD